MTLLKCFKCEKTFLGVRQYSVHFRRHHAIMVSRSYSSGFYCKQENCDKRFIRFDSLLRHIKKWHVVTDEICNSDIDSSKKSADYPSTLKKVQSSEESGNDSEQHNVCEDRDHCHESSKEFNLSTSAQQFIANLRILSSFTGTALTAITNAAQCLVSDISDVIREEILNFCKKQNISVESDTLALLNKLNLDNLFDKTNTLEDQINIVKNVYNYIDSIEIPLGFRLQQYFDQKEQVWRQKKIYETCHYIPIIETLKLIMCHSSMRNYVDSEQNNFSDDLLVTFTDGISYKQHPFFQHHPHALRIQLYYDDVVVNNPLGSKVHPHKIGAFYFVIQNLPQHINSFLGGIHILCLCHTADIQKYGMKAILKPFLMDINKLESDDGVYVVHNGTHFVLRASIAAVCADGLAAHQLLGFLSPSAKHFCRLCLINRDDFKNNRNLKDVTLRTKQLHDEQIKEINNQQTLKEIDSLKKKSGILEDSALHSSRYFHCTNNFVFDPMHDIFEGIAPMELKLILHYYSTCDYNFKIDVFNNRVNLFRYGFPENKNKPSANFSSTSIKYQKDYKLSQTAVQTWCLLRVFPFLVSDLVPENDKHLSLILLLNRINEIVFAPKLRRSILPYLAELIEEHNCLFRELFPAIAPINKHHHLTHYPQCISFSGPLRWLNCLRFEAKHNFLKKYGSIVCNFKNITKTLTNYCQLDQCAVWGTNEEPRIKLKYVNGRKTYVENTYCRQQLHQMKYQDKDTIIEVNKAEVYSTEYRKGLFVAINSGVQENSEITFGCIQELIILKDDQLWLWCEEWQCLGYNESLNAYRVAQNTGSYTFVNTDELCDLKPFALWSDFTTNFSYIVLHHMLL